jgi:hypothetical protein
MKFRTRVELHGKTATGIEVPEDIVTGLGTSKRPPVVVTIKGYSYRSTIVKMNGAYMLPLSAENRADTKVQAGEEIEIQVELDTAPREVELPQYFADILNQDPEMKQFFKTLSFTHKKEYVRWIEDAKQEETRKRRLEKAITMLREKIKHP